MADIAYSIEPPATDGQFVRGVHIVKWVLANGETGAPYIGPHFMDKSVQISGTPGAGGAGRVVGSNVPEGGTPVYGVLNDPGGTALTFVAADITANKIEQILENCTQIRPEVTAGDGTTAVTFRILFTSKLR